MRQHKMFCTGAQASNGRIYSLSWNSDHPNGLTGGRLNTLHEATDLGWPASRFDADDVVA